MASRAARPGVFALPAVSSLTVRQASQPQNMKIESDSPAVKAEKDWTANGSSQVQEKSREPAKSPERALITAITTKIASTASWRPTSAYWTPLVAVMPR